MNKAIRFINREKEVERIVQMATSPNTELLYIEGRGGLGKTRLLEEIPEVLKTKNINVACPDIIDFDDLTFQFSDNFIYLLLEQIPGITDQDKGLIHQELESLSWMERIGDSRRTQERQEDRIVEALARIINRLSEDSPIIFRFDTAEKMPSNIRRNILLLATYLTNADVIISGRPISSKGTTPLWEDIQNSRLSETSRDKIELAPFDDEASLKYLEEKEVQRNVTLSAKDTESLLLLAEGRPIIIDLAVEYFAKSPDFELEKDTGLLNISNTQLNKDSFERQIVQYVTALRGKMEQLILVLSRIFPLTETMIAQVLPLAESERQEFFNNAQSEVFIKSIRGSDGTVRITLHDEMRRLIQAHVWDEIDPSHHRRRRDSRIALAMFKSEDEKFHKQIQAIKEQKPILSRKRDSLAYIELMLLRHQREVATETWVKHALYSDFKRGFQEWQSLVEKARSEGRKYSFVARLCDLVHPYIQPDSSEPIPPDVVVTEQEKFDFRFIEARAKQDLGNYEEAEKIYRQLLSENSQNDAIKRQIFNMLGVLKRDQGLLGEAIKYQTICRKLQDEGNYWAIAKVENQLGYAYQLLKDTDPKSITKAQEHYENALSAARVYNKQVTDSDTKKQVMSHIASVKNNLGYIYGLRKEFNKAELYCKQAIDIWERVGRDREIGWAKTNLGVLARDQRQYQHAEQRLQEAILLLKYPDDFKELCQAYLQLGWTQWFMGVINTENEKREALLEEAMKSLEIGLQYALERDYMREQPDIYHQLASVYWNLGRETNDELLKQKARSYNQIAINISKELKNNRYTVDAIVGEMEFDYDSGNDERIQMHLEQLEPYRQYNYPLYFGRVHRILADWAFRRGDIQEAIDEYSKAMPLINRHGGYGPYTIEIELDNLAKKLESLSLVEAKTCLGTLKEKWLKQDTTGHLDLIFWIEEQIEQIELLGEGL